MISLINKKIKYTKSKVYQQKKLNGVPHFILFNLIYFSVTYTGIGLKANIKLIENPFMIEHHADVRCLKNPVWPFNIIKYRGSVSRMKVNAGWLFYLVYYKFKQSELLLLIPESYISIYFLLTMSPNDIWHHSYSITSQSHWFIQMFGICTKCAMIYHLWDIWGIRISYLII